MERPLKAITVKPYVPIENSFRNPIFSNELQLGSKNLKLVIDSTKGLLFATTFIENIKNEEIITGATTALYIYAAEIMQDTASSEKRLLFYLLRTKKQSMISWALDNQKGKKIFNWEGAEINEDGELVCITHISPIKS